jgi:hypothetical protein
MCRTWRAVKRVRLRTVLIGSAAAVFLSVNVASAVVAKRAVRDAQRALATADALDSATRTTLSLYEARLRRPPVSPAPPLPHVPPPRPVRSEARVRPGQGIFRLSPTEFYVDRSIVDEAFDGEVKSVGQARLLPDRESGKVSGLRVFDLDPNTVLGKLGIQSGDSIQAVDGLDITRPENVLDAYALLRSASDLTVRVRRHGSLVSLRYHLT